MKQSIFSQLLVGVSISVSTGFIFTEFFNLSIDRMLEWIQQELGLVFSSFLSLSISHSLSHPHSHLHMLAHTTIHTFTHSPKRTLTHTHSKTIFSNSLSQTISVRRYIFHFTYSLIQKHTFSFALTLYHKHVYIFFLIKTFS